MIEEAAGDTLTTLTLGGYTGMFKAACLSPSFQLMPDTSPFFYSPPFPRQSAWCTCVRRFPSGTVAVNVTSCLCGDTSLSVILIGAFILPRGAVLKLCIIQPVGISTQKQHCAELTCKYWARQMLRNSLLASLVRA